MCVGSSAWGWSGRFRGKGGHLLLPPHPLTALPRQCYEHTFVYKKVTSFCLARHLWTSLYSREHKPLTVDFRPARNRIGSPACAPTDVCDYFVLRVQNIREMIAKLDLYRQCVSEDGLLQKVLRYSTSVSAELPTWFCSGWKSTVLDWCARLYLASLSLCSAVAKPNAPSLRQKLPPRSKRRLASIR